MEAGKQDGARLAAGGKRVGSKGWFIEPTLFTGATQTMRIAREVMKAYHNTLTALAK